MCNNLQADWSLLHIYNFLSVYRNKGKVENILETESCTCFWEQETLYNTFAYFMSQRVVCYEIGFDAVDDMLLKLCENALTWELEKVMFDDLRVASG